MSSRTDILVGVNSYYRSSLLHPTEFSEPFLVDLSVYGSLCLWKEVFKGGKTETVLGVITDLNHLK